MRPVNEIVAYALVAVLVNSTLITAAHAALIPPYFIDGVVALGTEQPASGTQSKIWVTEGTGFLYGHLVADNPDPRKRQYEIYLVTAKHVVQGHLAAHLGDVLVRLNPAENSSPGREFSVSSDSPNVRSGWFFHPTADIAIALVDVSLLQKQGIKFSWFQSDTAVADTRKLKELQVSAGDGVFVLGFPMNLAGPERNAVVVRQGGVAKIDELLRGSSSTFMIDSFVFPGNSGSPVVLKPDAIAIEGTNSVSSAYLVGMVLAYVPYVDNAVSQQTGRQRITFEENSGLAQVISTDYIEETIQMWDSVVHGKIN